MILDWICNCCEKNYCRKEARYYCSLCDFNMCDKCYSEGKYQKKRVFPNNEINPSNIDIKNPKIKSKFHEHNLI